MRATLIVVIGIVLMPATIANPERPRLPTVSAETLTFGVVRRASDIGIAAGLGDSRDTLLVERPAYAREGAKASVFVVDEAGVLLKRVAVEYSRGSRSLIQIGGGISPGDRIVVSDTRAWDAYDRIRLKGH
jgi:hypothetical protein